MGGEWAEGRGEGRWGCTELFDTHSGSSGVGEVDEELSFMSGWRNRREEKLDLLGAESI